MSAYVGSSKNLKDLKGRVREREFVMDNLLVRIHLIIVMIRWSGLAPWEFEFPFRARRALPTLTSFQRVRVCNRSGVISDSEVPL